MTAVQTALPDADTALSGYVEDPRSPGYWFYKKLRIQADVATHQFVVRFARKHLSKGSAVLDVGTGEGALALQLADAGMQVSVSSWNDKCKLSVPQFAVDLDRPFGPHDVGGVRFPLVCCIEVIEHLENPARFLRDCSSIVTDDGILILSTPNVESVEARLQWLLRGYPSIFSGAEITLNRHISMLWGQGLEHLISLAGFEIVERHLLGEARLGGGLRSLAKRASYAFLRRVLPGDTRGTTRLYVLRRGTTKHTGHGPQQVY